VETAAATGSAVQGVAGRDVNNIYGRRTAFEMPFMNERRRAAQQAMEASKTGRQSDLGDIYASMLMRGGAGMAAGAATGGGIGAGIGALAGGIGAVPGGAIGAGIGGSIGGGLGGMSAIMGAMGDPRKRALLMSEMPLIGGRFKDQYQGMVADQFSKDYNTSYEAQKKQNPFKTATIGEYEQNYMRDLGAQRSMGLSDEGLTGKGGFMRSNIDAGFTPEMGLQMAGNIQQAGGSTRMARDSAFGNQLSRGANLTNAGQVLGSLSSGMGDSGSSKQATIKILAEGMRLGLDDSKFAEENRRFTQAAADIISKSGATSAADAVSTYGLFG
jgi:hypothetical protein